MVKGRKTGKAPSPRRQDRMLCALNHRQDITFRASTKLKSSLLPVKELNIDNNDLSTNSEYDNRSSINFLFHHALDQVDSNTDLLDEVVLTEVVLRPTKKSKECRPTQIDSKEK